MSNKFFDDWEKDFDKSFRRTGRLVGIGFITSLIASLIMLGVGIWAVESYSG